MINKPSYKFFEQRIRKFIKFFVTISVLLTVALTSEAVQSRSPKIVLLLNSYHRGFSWSDSEEDSVRKHLADKFLSVDVLVEYLDAKRNPEKRDLIRMKNYLVEKYSGKKIDLIIALDDAAVDMLTDYHTVLFSDVPVVFAGVANFKGYAGRGRKRITGVLESQDIKKTIDIAIQLHPGTNEILSVSDMTVSGISARRGLEAIIPEYHGRIKFRFLPACTFEEARVEVAALSPDSIVLLNTYTTDSSGKTLSTKDSTQLIVSAAKVPVYGVHQNRFGDGIVGGYLLSGREHGKKAAYIGLRILAGENPDTIAIEKKGSSLAMFDYKQMERFDISLSRLPKGSIVLDKPESVFETHPKFTVTIIATLILLFLVVSLLALFIVRQRQAKAALRENEAKMISILDNIGIGVVLISPEMKILELNKQMREWFPGIDPGQHAICHSIFIDPPKKEVCHFCPVSKTLHDGRVHETTIKPHRLEGKRNFRLVSSPIFDQSGQVKAVIEMVEDVTEKLSLESQLRQAQKMESVGRLAGGVAHDFNNMLSVILGYGELALEQTDPSYPLHLALQEIMKAAERSADITRQLLAFARKQTISPKVIRINKTVGGMTSMLQRLIGENIDLAWLPGEAIWPVMMDPTQISQILANLCINAKDAISDVGKVTIETGNTKFNEAYCKDHLGFRPGEYVFLAVSDNGCGMDAETLDNIFDPFFTTKESGRGTGLGLAMVYGIIKQNNGFINVYSEPGYGTTIKIYLPRLESQSDEMSKVGTDQPVKRGRETILVVEDEPAILHLVKMMLENLGYNVVASGTTGEATTLAREHSGEIHLLLTDVIMPEMNGPDLAKHIMSFYPDLKSLFMSGYTANVIAHHGVLDEGVNFITKPFSKDQLGAKVREALDKDKV